ncbi:hypothetical protein KY284_000900 [Solanum tuberosum]|nr:hypothetical protein KY284_000900 [Solanum tuberosum]
MLGGPGSDASSAPRPGPSTSGLKWCDSSVPKLSPSSLGPGALSQMVVWTISSLFHPDAFL